MIARFEAHDASGKLSVWPVATALGSDKHRAGRYSWQSCCILSRGVRKSMSLKQRIISDLTASMKAQDAPRTSTLRMVKAAMMNREIEKGGELDDEEMMKLLRSLVKQRRDSVEQYEKGGRQELADKEKTEIDVIEAYLPQAASRDEIEAAVAAAISETGASSMKDIGRVMKAAQVTLAGKNADGRTVSEIVKAKLGG
jgi:uncharacterized protein YqeY